MGRPLGVSLVADMGTCAVAVETYRIDHDLLRTPSGISGITFNVVHPHPPSLTKLRNCDNFCGA